MRDQLVREAWCKLHSRHSSDEHNSAAELVNLHGVACCPFVVSLSGTDTGRLICWMPMAASLDRPVTSQGASTLHN